MNDDTPTDPCPPPDECVEWEVPTAPRVPHDDFDDYDADGLMLFLEHALTMTGSNHE